MNDRNKKLAVTVVLILFGGLLLYFVATTLYGWIEERYAALDKQEKALSDARAKEQQLKRAKAQLDRWRSISLPGIFDDANSRYRSLLYDLLQAHKLYVAQMPDATSRTTRQGTKFFNILTYSWKVEGTAPQLVGFLEDFHRLNLPHAIRELKADNPTGERGAQLVVDLKIEALSFVNAVNRESLLALPDKSVMRLEMLAALSGSPTTGLPFALSQFTPTGLYGSVDSRVTKPSGDKSVLPWPIGPHGLLHRSRLSGDAMSGRDYRRIGSKNPFAGVDVVPTVQNQEPQPDVEILKYLKVTQIEAMKPDRTGTFIVKKVCVFDRLQKQQQILRDEPPLNELVIRDGNNHELLRARVVQIADDLRSIIVEHKEKYFIVHIDESFADALRLDRALSEERLKIFKLTPANGKETNGKEVKEPPEDAP